MLRGRSTLRAVSAPLPMTPRGRIWSDGRRSVAEAALQAGESQPHRLLELTSFGVIERIQLAEPGLTRCRLG
jgi:hypothetical protein